MRKLELIEEINVSGEIYYWSEYNGERVTPYSQDKQRALIYFNEFKPIIPSKEVIKSKDI